ncbi:hypothetical protein QQ008_10170 [Fulvivirgaceae bacterium BMA10]|uniref:Adhesin domain-containing protein n=1 Tax=Splendidivirga corallicola TaxID=3051826 RepID=A0ABT8KLY8_9BACT|nr:hypothetical protein [Fulvivirgaceae bacterium BMA10]
MSKSIFKLFLALSIIFGWKGVSAQSETKLSKTITQQFNVSNGSSIDIKNKYGQVIIDTWDRNEVSLKIEVTAFGRNKAASEKILNRVDFDFDKAGSFLNIETVLDRKSGFFKELWNDIGDYSKTLLSKNKLTINYEIQIPETARIKIENKFGDVYLGDLDNQCKIELSNGNLKANNLNGYTDISLSFGDASIKYIKDGNMELKVSDSEIIRVGRIDINSSSSKILIHEADRLKINSRNDKLKINEVNHFFGKSSFSKVDVVSLHDITDLDMNYGEFAISRVHDSFSKIQLTGKSTDFNIKFDRDSYFNADLKAREDELELPDNTSVVDKEYTDDKETFVSLLAKIGNTKSNPAMVNINAMKGDVKLDFVKDNSR